MNREDHPNLIYAERFVVLFKRYTSVTERKLLELLSTHFQLQRNDMEELSMLFLEDGHFGEDHRLHAYVRALTVPISLQGTTLEQAKKWLVDYSPGLWLSLEQGTLVLPEEEAIRNTEEQCRFLIELAGSLSWVEIARAFGQEYDTDLVKNMADHLCRLHMRRSEMVIWTNYAKRRDAGFLLHKDAEQAKEWLTKYMARTITMRSQSPGFDEEAEEKEEGGMDRDGFHEYLFIVEMRVYFSWSDLVGPYCQEFGVKKIIGMGRDLARSFTKRKTDPNWIAYDRRRTNQPLTREQKAQVKRWFEKYLTAEKREEVHLNQERARAEWAKDEMRCSTSDAFLATQMQAASQQSSSKSNSSPSSGPRKFSRLRKNSTDGSPYARPRPRQRNIDTLDTLEQVPEETPTTASTAALSTTRATSSRPAPGIATARRGGSIADAIILDEEADGST